MSINFNFFFFKNLAKKKKLHIISNYMKKNAFGSDSSFDATGPPWVEVCMTN